MAYQSRRSLVLNQLYSQTTIIILAIINTYYPEYLNYTFIVFIILFFVMTILRTRPRFSGISSSQLKEIRESKKVHEGEVSEVMRVMSLDAQLTHEIKPLTRFFSITLILMVFTMIWYYLYFNFSSSLTQDPSLPGTQKFIIFLIGYEVPIVLMAVVSLNQNKLLRGFPQIPRYYTLFEKGLVGQNTFMKFPLEEHDIRLDAKRGFVELIDKGKGGIRIRLYSSKPKELFELIKNYAFEDKYKNG
ncbi:MAG: DUF2208 family protein [Nitrososphaerota archaeon]|nr:DUF2208 family protein [Nitrososphaerota archaeon]